MTPSLAMANGEPIPEIEGLEVAAAGAFLFITFVSYRQQKIRSAQGASADSSMSSKMLAMLTHGLFVGALALRGPSTSVSEEMGRSLYQAYQIVLSIHITTWLIAVLPFLGGIWKPLGVLILAFEQMVLSIGAFVTFSLVLAGAFSFGVYGLHGADMYTVSWEGDADNDPLYYSKPWMVPILGYFGPAKIQTQDFRNFSLILILGYLFLTTKVLQSMLMALFAAVHQRVFKNSEKEYTYQKAETAFNYTHAASPLLFALGTLNKLCMKASMRSSVTDGAAEKPAKVQVTTVYRDAFLHREQAKRAASMDAKVAAIQESIVHHTATLKVFGDEMKMRISALEAL
eukprot:2042994-Prymnesium_polylepis.1